MGRDGLGVGAGWTWALTTVVAGEGDLGSREQEKTLREFPQSRPHQCCSEWRTLSDWLLTALDQERVVFILDLLGQNIVLTCPER